MNYVIIAILLSLLVVFALLFIRSIISKEKFTHTKSEVKATSTLKSFCDEYNVDFHYYINAPLYFIDHLIPLYFAYPASFIYLSDDNNAIENKKMLITKYKFDPSIFVEYTLDDLRDKLISDKTFYLIGCTGDRRLEVSNIERFVILNHGIDEDIIWGWLGYSRSIAEGEGIINKHNPSGGWLTLQLTESHKKIRKYAGDSIDEIKDYYHIDSSKKTILYSSTIGGEDGNYIEFIEQYPEQIVQQLDLLKTKYNVILRLHPLIPQDIFNKLRQKGFIIAPKDKFPSVLTTIKLADLIIGPPTGIVCLSTYFSDKPIIRLLPYDSSNSKIIDDAQALYTKNEGLVLTDKHIYSIATTEIDSISKSVETALKDQNEQNETWKNKKIAKNEYFRTWYGEISGYEDYRVFTRIFRTINTISNDSIDILLRTLSYDLGKELKS